MRKEFKFKKAKGITLISLVITIIVLIILSSVAIYLSLGNNGIFNKAKEAKELNNKQEATEKINLKITTAQMNKYAEKQEMPTLQELADILYKDNEIQYVALETQVASKEKITVGEKTSIFTKLKQYPYEFEINSSLQLASINGVKVASNNDKSNEYSLEETKTNETWMGKPIYRKTIFIESLPNNTTKTYAHSIENIETIWINTGKSFMFWNDEETAPIPITHNEDVRGQMEIHVNHEGIIISTKTDRSSKKAYVSIEYTKVTDNI